MTEIVPVPESRKADLEFRAVYEAHCGYVLSTLRRLGVRERDLEDVGHEVFLAVYRRLRDYDGVRPLRPWLFGFCFRGASNFRARAHHRREVVEDNLDELVADAAPAADEQIAAGQRRALVNAALAKIELSRRAVFVMHEIDGCAIPDVASALGISPNTAYSRLRVAREEFSAAVKRLGGLRRVRKTEEGHDE